MTGRGSISRTATLRLWVLAGGRCEYRGCNTHLLEDDVTSFELNLADRAHIVGATDAPGSPRGDDPLALDERNAAENLMLLCRAHHRLIDQRIDEHPVSELRRMKREHETRIRLLTDLQDDAATVVVRAVGGIRGAPVEVPRDAVLAAVRADRRFPRYPLALAGEDLEIDLRGLPNESDPAYWQTGTAIIAEQAARIRDARTPIRHISVFAITRIPLLIALGFHLDDKIPTTVYGRRRDGTGDKGWGFDPDAEPVQFDVHHIAGPVDSQRVALAVSVTAPIAEEVAAAVGPDHAVYELAPLAGAHGRDLLGARISLDHFADAYHRFLATTEAQHAACDVIDLFAAVPVTGAVQLGRGLMRDVQPGLRVHDRGSDGVFREALVLGRQPARSGRIT
jgi:SMODS-associated and fused to various effectors sensor domain